MKCCSKCRIKKPLDAFYKDAGKKDGKSCLCKVCALQRSRKWKADNAERHRAYSRKYRLENLELVSVSHKRYREANLEKVSAGEKRWRDANPNRVKAAKKKYYAENTEKVKARVKKWQQDNWEVASARQKKWREANPEKMNGFREKWVEGNPGMVRMYILKRLQRCPSWADKEKILAFYKKAKLLTEQTGIVYHVDHIIPLNGEMISGLHVHENLQILTAEENMRKGNRYDCQ